VLSGSAIQEIGVLKSSEVTPDYMRAKMSSEFAGNGLRLLRKWSPGLSTMDVATEIGKVIDIGAVLPGSGIPTVQAFETARGH
jgi:hypothetical protein